MNYIVFGQNRIILCINNLFNFEQVLTARPVRWRMAGRQKEAQQSNMANDSYMTVKFPSLKKLMDFVRACHMTNYELNVAKTTLTSHLQGGEINLAMSYGATVIEENHLQQPAKA